MAMPNELSPTPICREKNTFIDLKDETLDSQSQVRGTKSCLAGCWSYHGRQGHAHQGRAGSVAEVASHWDTQHKASQNGITMGLLMTRIGRIKLRSGKLQCFQRCFLLSSMR